MGGESKIQIKFEKDNGRKRESDRETGRLTKRERRRSGER